MKKDNISKEELTRLYLELNYTRQQVADYYGISDHYVKKLLHDYGITKNNKLRFENVKKTNRERYGVSYPFVNKQIREKACDAMRETYQSRPKVKIISQKLFQQMKQEKGLEEETSQIEEGEFIFKSRNPLTVAKQQQKYRAQLVQRAGELGLTVEEYRQQRKKEGALKSRQTLFDKEGCTSTAQLKLSPSTRKILSSQESFLAYLYENRDKSAEEVAKQLGMALSSLYARIAQYGGQFILSRSSSIPERYISDHLVKMGVECVTRSRTIIPPYELDIFIPRLNMGIEYNGDYWHSTLFRDENYHINKTNLCNKRGIFLLQVFEYTLRTFDKYYMIDYNKINRLIKFVVWLYKGGEHRLIEHLGNLKKQLLVVDRATMNDSWFIKAGYDKMEQYSPQKHEVNIGSQSLTIYDCGTTVWRRR